MRDQLTQVVTKIQDLETLVKFLQENLNHNITTFWTILGFLVLATGGALYFLVKALVNTRVENELVEIKKNLAVESKSYVDSLPPKHQFSWSSGNTIINHDGVFTITGLIVDLKAFNAFHIIEVTTLLGRRLNFDVEISNKNLVIRLIDLNRNEVFQHGWAAVNWKVIWLKEYI